MQRIKLICAMCALTVLMVLSVRWGSPYAPVVAPVCDIEEIWAIEDARQESDEPLVTSLQNNGIPLAYDAESDTFYCTLGLSHEADWPDIHLTAPGAQGIGMIFADDYAYDFCADAIHEGYSYQILCYSEDAFHYTQVVFTGLPLVSIHCDEEIGDVDTPMQIAISSYGSRPVISAGNVHLRGKGSRNEEKKNLKVEFTRTENGKRNMLEVPGFGLKDEILLNPMVFDELLIREKLSWDIYGQMLGPDYPDGFEARRTSYVEVFLNDAYYGVYLMMDSMDEEGELRKRGDAHLLTDSVYRTLPTRYAGERPVLAKPGSDGSVFELRYEPNNAVRHAAMNLYLDLLCETDEAAFVEKAEACMDVESVVRYEILMQAAGLTDNSNNNAYIWARHTGDGMRYQFVPWDMDMSWGQAWGDVALKLGEQFDSWRAFRMLDKIVALNVGGAADLMVRQWRIWRESIFTTEHISGLMQGYFNELNESGALVRNAERWGLNADTEGYEIIEYADLRFAALDRAMDIVESRGGEVPAFLKDVDQDLNCYPITE